MVCGVSEAGMGGSLTLHVVAPCAIVAVVALPLSIVTLTLLAPVSLPHTEPYTTADSGARCRTMCEPKALLSSMQRGGAGGGGRASPGHNSWLSGPNAAPATPGSKSASAQQAPTGHTILSESITGSITATPRELC